MFEKSLVDLIRGLRGHKGREAEYIQSALKECRTEIRSQDMDLKATAMLKLIYLEMFGYDMTWAAFNVLEVMSASKHIQKRVGYLGAVQSFRPETEVLMLAENLLKKDLSSPSIPTLILPLVTLPHIITPSLALSILPDLLPRLSHSQPSVRKKTIVTMYRLALVYPETLRVAWPKIKERLLDEHEDSSVTAATVNVVCELGWRRPQDFLPLAPRLFELLIDSGNNWMAIKIIKLFAVLTPLEPRLVKKLVRPLTNLIQTTTAMSLLYECISGIIQGGILDGVESGVDTEEVADLCISKLRGMIVLEGDPNLKYVALLAFNKIVVSHPQLVSMQQDVILACLDDPDISIRLQALDLASGMVSSDNLQNVVNRLLTQLANAPSDKEADAKRAAEEGETTDLEQRLVPDKRGSDLPPLPDEYRQEIITKILDMCTHNTYANIVDFEWYIDVLLRLIKQLPAHTQVEQISTSLGIRDDATNLAARIGGQLIDITVRVVELRPESVKACENLTLISNRTMLFASHSAGLNEVVRSTAWICGEFTSYLSQPYDVLNSLVHESSVELAATTLAIVIQAIPKVFAAIATMASQEWNASRKGTISLMLARIVDFLEKLSAHPNLEVQERSVEFLELLKVGSEALSSLSEDSVEAPLLLTSAIPNLFASMDLNPVSALAQKKVPVPADLDLDAPINPRLEIILRNSQLADNEDNPVDAAFHTWYTEREVVHTTATFLQPGQQPSYRPASPTETEPISYQAPPSPTTLARIKAERAARTRDDPFYIASGGSGTSTPNHQISDIIHRSNGNEEFDIDSIPIIDLKIDHSQFSSAPGDTTSTTTATKKKKKAVRKFNIVADETVGGDEGVSSTKRASSTSRSQSRSPAPSTLQSRIRPTRNLLSVDSTSLGSINLNDDDVDVDASGTSLGGNLTSSRLEIERRLAEEAEMAAALKEVERKRLELAREEERNRTKVAEGVEADAAVVVKKKKKKKASRAVDVGEATGEDVGFGSGGGGGGVVDDAVARDEAGEDVEGNGGDVVKKKKKVKKVKKVKKKSKSAGDGDNDDADEGHDVGTKADDGE